MANFLNTRIRLKYDLYSNWHEKNPVLLEGEVAIAVPGTNLGTVNTAASCLMKVGNGTSNFNDLPWLAAPAADVHEWAKKGEQEFKDWLVSEAGPHLANKSDLAALKSELNTSISNVDAALTNYKNALGFNAPAEGKTVAAEIAETYATKTEVTALDNKIGHTDTDKTLVDTIAETYATKVSMAADIKAEADRAKSAEGALDTAIKAEKTRAEGAEANLKAAIDALAGEGEGSVDAKIKAAIDKEVEDRDAAILVETNARKGEITRVEGLIDAEESRATGVEAGLAGRITTIEGDYLKAADKTELQGNIDAVADAVELLANGTGTDEIDSVKELIDYVKAHGPEVTEMQNGIKANTAAIESEAARATKAEADEAKAREDADAALGVRIDAANTALGNYKADIGFTKSDDNKTLMQTIEATYATKAALAEEVATLNETIENINSDASGLAARVTANENKLVNIGGEGQPATVIAAIEAAEGRAATVAQNKADAAKQAAIDAAATDATTKANNALADAKTYTDGEIDKIESTIAELKNFDKTAITGAINEDTNVLTLGLDGKSLDLVFCCGSATENV